MELLSPSHGKFIYKEEEVINFEKNIPGFDNLKKFILKDIDDGTFKILQCIEDINIGFIVVEPFTIDKNYEINLSDEVINSLNIKSFNDVALYSLVTFNFTAIILSRLSGLVPNISLSLSDLAY